MVNADLMTPKCLKTRRFMKYLEIIFVFSIDAMNPSETISFWEVVIKTTKNTNANWILVLFPLSYAVVERFIEKIPLKYFYLF